MKNYIKKLSGYLGKMATPLGLLGLIIFLWFTGAHFFKYSFWIFAGIFGPTSDLQNVFSPVSALFTGIAAWGAIYTIYQQVVLSANQQFENIFFNLLNIHDSNSRHMLFPVAYLNDIQLNQIHRDGPYVVGQEAFIYCYELLYNMFAYGFSDETVVQSEEQELPEVIRKDIYDNCNASINEDGTTTLSDARKFEIIYDIFTQYTDKYYSSYARHLYQTLKHVNDNAPGKFKKIYIRILRSQLSLYETSLLYYRAIMSPDKDLSNPRKTKYQILIEKTSFLHLLCDDMSKLFDNNLAGEMDDSAFDCKNN